METRAAVARQATSVSDRMKALKKFALVESFSG
jgi:hypothetical protein